MNLRRVALGAMVVGILGVLSLAYPAYYAAGDEAIPTIQMGEFYFGAPGNEAPVGDAAKPELNILTVSGAASGEIVLILENKGVLEHEVLSNLFFITTEAKIKSFDANGNEISKIESVGSLREVELQPGMKAEVTLALDESLVRAFEDDPTLELKFEITCQVGHGSDADHYKSGMRGFITLKA